MVRLHMIVMKDNVKKQDRLLEEDDIKIPLRDYLESSGAHRNGGEWSRDRVAETGAEYRTLMQELSHYLDVGDSMLPEKTPWRGLVPPTTTGLDNMSLEDRIRLLYTVNSVLGASYRPHGHRDSIATYVAAALDQPIRSNNPDYEDLVLQRAYSVFENPNTISPEEFAELRRIGERLSISQKVTDYDFYACYGLPYLIHTDVLAFQDRGRRNSSEWGGGLLYNGSLSGRTRVVEEQYKSLAPDSTAASQLAALDDFDDSLDRRTTWYESTVLFLLTCWSKIGAMLPEYPWFFDIPKFSKVSNLGLWNIPVSARKQPVKLAARGCGTETILTPMKEDVGKYFSDVDFYLRSIE